MIELRNLCYRYVGQVTNAIDSVSLDLQDDGFVAVMGSNGSGKSTLARCLNGLHRPSSGTVTIDGIRTDDRENVIGIRRKIGLVFQDPNLQMTSMSVERELAFGLENLGIEQAEMRERVEAQLNRMNLEQYRDMAPSSLSGGEKQRLAIASVLIMEPRYIIFDEATSLLSGASRQAVLGSIHDAWSKRRCGIMLITQFPSEALLAQRLIVLHEGRVVADDHPDTVIANATDLAALGVPVPLKTKLMSRK